MISHSHTLGKHLLTHFKICWSIMVLKTRCVMHNILSLLSLTMYHRFSHLLAIMLAQMTNRPNILGASQIHLTLSTMSDVSITPCSYLHELSSSLSVPYITIGIPTVEALKMMRPSRHLLLLKAMTTMRTTLT